VKFHREKYCTSVAWFKAGVSVTLWHDNALHL